MARLLPSDITAAALAGAHPGEVETLKLLSRGLSDDYSVFHSVHWSMAGKKSTAFGEIDFAIVNRSGDVVFIEQKNGPLDESTGELAKRYHDKTKRLSSQVQRNIGNLRSKFSDQHGSQKRLEVDYLIYCPDHTVININAPAIDMERVVDAASKAPLVKHIEDILGPGVENEDRWVRTVERFFAQTLEIAPDVSAYVSTQERIYTQMLDGLGSVIRKLEFSPYRLRVIGTAGCGKSQLTMSFCERQLQEGRRPLVLCFNRPFADKVASLAEDDVTVDTYYGFCKKTLESLADGVKIEPTDEPGFWRGVQEQLMGVDIPEDAMFDALVVDEGQDFKQEWWDILQLFLRKDAAVLWLEDPMQNLRDTDPVELDAFVTYQEHGSFRTPATIAPVIREALEVDFDHRNELPGLGVKVVAYEQPNDQFKLVAHRINELKKAGFADDSIVIVSCRGMASSAFGAAESIGSHSIRRFTGEYSSGGEQIYTKGKVYFDTIYRFKGQQAPAIILVDIDKSLDDTEFAKRVLYCGMTRASVRLEMLVQKDNLWLPRLEAAA